MKVIAFLTDGFETVEALAVIDLLRRAEILTETVSITGKQAVRSAQGITVLADCCLEEAQLDNADLLFLPGGPGHTAYLACDRLTEALKAHYAKGKHIAAICAAPSVLGKLGMLKDRKAVAFPGFENDLIGAEVLTAPVRVVTDGNITTSRGMGTSLDLGLELVRILAGEDKARDLGKSTQYTESNE